MAMSYGDPGGMRGRREKSAEAFRRAHSSGVRAHKDPGSDHGVASTKRTLPAADLAREDFVPLRKPEPTALRRVGGMRSVLSSSTRVAVRGTGKKVYRSLNDALRRSCLVDA